MRVPAFFLVLSKHNSQGKFESMAISTDIMIRTVRTELVEVQSRTYPDEVLAHHEVCRHMLRQAQHERFPGYLSLISKAQPFL